MYTRSPDYLYCRNGIFYFTRNVPSDLKPRFNKNRVVVSLQTRSITRAQKSASALSDRLDRYFESLRLERFHSQELGLKFDANMVAPRTLVLGFAEAVGILPLQRLKHLSLVIHPTERGLRPITFTNPRLAVTSSLYRIVAPTCLRRFSIHFSEIAISPEWR